LGWLLEAERAAELVQQGLAYSYLPSLEAVLSSELHFLAPRYHSLTSILSLRERRTRQRRVRVEGTKLTPFGNEDVRDLAFALRTKFVPCPTPTP